MQMCSVSNICLYKKLVLVNCRRKFSELCYSHDISIKHVIVGLVNEHPAFIGIKSLYPRVYLRFYLYSVGSSTICNIPIFIFTLLRAKPLVVV